ncbi:MAG TPA: DipZ protein, partial [Baekduia sp.]|nr:DipZ protein [Baekduia sp.]
MRAPTDTIAAPMFPKEVQWANVAMLSMAKQAGRPVLLEFFDFCRVSSLRTLEYTKQWHARYAEEDLRVISVHCPGYPPSHDVEAVRAAVERLGIEHPVCIDQEFLMWRRFENQGWPARYLFDRRLRLFEYHYGEGAYAETEAAIQELLGVDRPLIEPL